MTSPRPCGKCGGSGWQFAPDMPDDPELSIFWRHRCVVCGGSRVAVHEYPRPDFPATLPAHPDLVAGVCASGEIVV